MHLKQSDFDAHGLTQGCPGCRAMREGIRAQGHSAICRARMEELLRGTAKGQQRLEEAERRTRDTAGERAAKRIKLQFADRPADPVSSSSASRSDATAGGDAASASNVVAGSKSWQRCRRRCRSRCSSRHRDVGRDDRRRTIPRETEDDEERAKRQRKEKKTELEMEVSSVAKINDSDEFWTYDATDGSWKTSDTVTQRCSVPVNCVPESSARAAPSGTNWNQHGIYAEHKRHKGWDTCANSSAGSQTIPRRRASRTAQGAMPRLSVEASQDSQYQSSRTSTTSAAVCREPRRKLDC